MLFVFSIIAIFILIGLTDFFKTKNYDDFLVAGRNQTTLFVTFSLLATILGGSATVGLINKSASMGSPWFWWLGVGSIGLFLQAFLLTEKVRNLKAYTLPDVVYRTMGRPASMVSGLIIVISWIAIVSAQFLAAAKVMHGMLPHSDFRFLLVLTASAIILYAFLGGQKSIIKTDTLQFVFIILGLIATFVILYFFKEQRGQAIHWEFFNEQFGIKKWFSILILTGGAYFVGPDMFSRILTAKDGKSAKKSVLYSAGILIFLAVMIVLIGKWIGSHFPNSKDAIKSLFHELPPITGWLLSIGFISAMISSADTILLTSASIIENDLIGAFKKQKDFLRLWITRVLVVVIGLVSLLIALFNQSIIGLLLKSYSIYTPGIVPPLSLAILAHQHLKINRIFFFAALLIGGSLGLIGSLFSLPFLPIVGFFLSFFIAFLGTIIAPAVKHT